MRFVLNTAIGAEGYTVLLHLVQPCESIQRMCNAQTADADMREMFWKLALGSIAKTGKPTVLNSDRSCGLTEVLLRS